MVITYELFESMKKEDDIYVHWNSDVNNIEKDNKNYYLNKHLVMVL